MFNILNVTTLQPRADHDCAPRGNTEAEAVRKRSKNFTSTQKGVRKRLIFLFSFLTYNYQVLVTIKIIELLFSNKYYISIILPYTLTAI